MTKIQMIQTIDVSDLTNMILFLSLGNLIFEFVSHFDIRISNFANDFCANHAIRAQTKPGPSGVGLLRCGYRDHCSQASAGIPGFNSRSGFEMAIFTR